MEPSSERTDEITDLLAAYALDALEPGERMRVQRLLAERPELQQTVTELRAAANLLPHSLERPTLPSEWRQRTLDYALGRRLQAHKHPLVGQRLGRWRAWVIGFGSLSALLLVAILMLIGLLNDVRRELAVVAQQRDQAQALAATAQASAQQVATLLTNSTPLATLTGDAGQGVVLRDAAGNLVLIAILPPSAANQVYQLWLIENDAAPVSGGVFTVDAGSYGVVPLPAESARRGITLAITAEPAPGSPGPTSAILISGRLT